VAAAESRCLYGGGRGSYSGLGGPSRSRAITVPAGGVAPVSADAGRKLIVSVRDITRVSFAEVVLLLFCFSGGFRNGGRGIVLRLRSQSRRQGSDG